MAGIIVVGAGPQIGAAVARRFAKDALPVTVIARSQATVSAVLSTVATSGEVQPLGLTANVRDERGLREALDTAVAAHGAPEVVVYNAARIVGDRLDELTPDELLDSLAVNAVGGVITGAHLMPLLRETSGSLLFTGGMPTAKNGVASLSLGKAALRSVAEIFRAENHDGAVHIATVTVGGVVSPGTYYDPDRIAQEFARLHAEPRDQWRSEVLVQEPL